MSCYRKTRRQSFQRFVTPCPEPCPPPPASAVVEQESWKALSWAAQHLHRPGDYFHLLHVLPEPETLRPWTGIYTPVDEEAQENAEVRSARLAGLAHTHPSREGWLSQRRHITACLTAVIVVTAAQLTTLRPALSLSRILRTRRPGCGRCCAHALPYGTQYAEAKRMVTARFLPLLAQHQARAL